jgi:putative ABC transport system substrate-binding protein
VIDRRAFVATTVCILAVPLTGLAPQAGRVYRIGYLSVGRPPTSGFVERLRELGYIEGQNLHIEYRHWGSRPDRIEELAADLVRAKVDVILATGPDDVAGAMKATRTIPIVMVFPGDPVELGFVRSLARPGGNVTGMSWAPDITLTEKAVEILKEAVPAARTIGVLWNQNNRSHPLYADAARRATQRLATTYVSLGVRGAADFPGAFREAARQGVDGIVVFPDPLTVPNHKQITDLALSHRLPLLVTSKLRFDSALLIFGAKVSDNPRRAAEYVDRIFNGAAPGALPIEQPTVVELIVNKRTAAALGLTIPSSLLLRADQVIE